MQRLKSQNDIVILNINIRNWKDNAAVLLIEGEKDFQPRILYLGKL